MDFLAHLSLAFQVALEPANLLMGFIGVLIGTLIGVLPGLGPVTTLSLLLPITYKIGPVQSIIMLAGIYYGAQYGGSTTSILLNIPGEASTMVTCLDGYQMARKGRAGAALSISAIGSFVGGTFALIMMIFLSPLLAGFALRFDASVLTCGWGALSEMSANKLRILCILAEERFELAPDAPASKELGYPIGIPDMYVGSFVRRDTPKEIVARLEEAIKKVTSDPEVKEKMNKLGMPAYYRNSREFEEMVQSLGRIRGEYLRQLGII